jgi:hypothetical protein
MLTLIFGMVTILVVGMAIYYSNCKEQISCSKKDNDQ